MKNHKGFSLVEGLLILVIIGLLGGTGWYVWHSKNSADKSLTAANTSSSTQLANKNTPKTTPYTFTQLGIAMDVLSGWEVKNATTTEEGSNFYSWTVTKSGVDGKVSLSSSGFQGGFYSCAEMNDPLTPVTVNDVAPTQNNNLTFMSLTYKDGGESNNMINLVKSDEAILKATNNVSATPLKNKDVKAGNYFLCLSEPTPGFSLNLNKEAAPGFSRRDKVTALSTTSSNTTYVPLSPTAQSYADIKTMLTSIK